MRGDKAILSRTLTEAELMGRARLLAGSAAERMVKGYGDLYPGRSLTVRWVLMTTHRAFGYDTGAAFAQTGNPSNPKLGTWPAYDGTRTTMVFDNEPKVIHNPLGAERHL